MDLSVVAAARVLKSAEQVAATRQRQLARGEYFEAVTAAIPPAHGHHDSHRPRRAAPDHEHATATTARPEQMLLF